METGKYLTLWTKYLPIIRIQLKKSFQNEQLLQLNEIEFEKAGDRESSSYTFNLEIQNGKVTNDISGTAVARDLYQILKNNAALVEYYKGKKIKINMGKNFILKFRVAVG